jgi:uncharacterized protein (DUF362 family)
MWNVANSRNPIRLRWGSLRKIEIASDVLRADFVINLPKLKSHSQMLLTLGVKNLYGCVVGLRKPEWHFRTGVNREKLRNLLLKEVRRKPKSPT